MQQKLTAREATSEKSTVSIRLDVSLIIDFNFEKKKKRKGANTYLLTEKMLLTL